MVKKSSLCTAIGLCIACMVTPIFTANAQSGNDQKNATLNTNKLFDQVNIKYEQFTLPNGLSVLVVPNHNLPEVTVAVYYRIGSKNEQEGKTGFAHLYEHLMFRGTKNAPGKFMTHLNKVGASNMNGTTYNDYTFYRETVPTGALDYTLWFEGDRMANVTDNVTAKILEEERAIVKNEKRERESAPGQDYIKLFRDHFYPKDHPYSHPIIGSMADINNAALDDVEHWYHEYFGATNVTLLLAGGVTVEQAKEKVAKYFSDVPAGKKVTRLAEYVPTFTNNKYVETRGNFPSTQITRNWHIPGEASKDTVLLEFISQALAGDRNSPLFKRLVTEKGLVQDIYSSLTVNEVSSYFTLNYSISPNSKTDIDVINATIDQELANFFKNGPDMRFLERQLLINDKRFITQAKDIGEFAKEMALDKVIVGNTEFFKTKRKWQAQATQQELANVAKKWLSTPYLQITTLPKQNVSNMTPTVDRSTIPEVLPTNAKITFPDFQQATLANGMKVVLVEDQTLPTASFSFVIENGSQVDSHYVKGTARLALSQMTQGNRKWDKNQMIEKMQKQAISIMASANTTQSTMSFDTLTPYLDDALEMTAESLLYPSYDENELQRLRQMTEANYAQMMAYPDNRTLLAKQLWGKEHTIAHINSLEQELAPINRDNLVAFHKNELGPNLTTVWIYGDITLDEAKAKLESYFGEWQSVKPSEPIEVAPAKTMANSIVLIDEPGARSTRIQIAQLTPNYDAKTEHAINLMNGVIGGGGDSRLNQKLRMEKGWSYGVRSTYDVNAEGLPSTFSISLNVQTDKTAESLVEINQVINEFLTSKSITQTELNNFRDLVVKSLPSALKSDEDKMYNARNSAKYGLPFNHMEGEVDRYNKVTLQQAQRAAKQIIQPSQFVYQIVGDVKQIEQSIRDLNLGDVQVWDSQGNQVR